MSGQAPGTVGMPLEFETARLRLRRPLTRDVDALLAIHSDPLACRHNPGDLLRSRRHAWARFDRWNDQWDEFGFGYYAVTGVESDAVIGFCGFKTIEALGHRAMNLFYRFDPAVWGRGLASECAGAVVERADDRLRDWPMIARVRPPNAPSRRIVERAGFELVPGRGVVGPDGYEDTFVRSWRQSLDELGLILETMPTELRTERLWLTPVSVDDAVALREVVAERDAPAPSLADVRDGIVRRDRESNGIWFYALRHAPGDEMFGYCGLLVGRASREEPEIGYEILSTMRNRGYASEAAGAVIQAARATGRRRLWSTVRTWNTPSLRVLAKHGFVSDHSRHDDRGELIYLRLEL